jgi:hypothetical protein
LQRNKHIAREDSKAPEELWSGMEVAVIASMEMIKSPLPHPHISSSSSAAQNLM